MRCALLQTLRTNLLLLLVGVLMFVMPLSAMAQFNPEINYQGKLTNGSGVAVADGTYNMNFWLVPTSCGATSTAVWSEARTGANRVQVTDGLFSVMLGDVSTLASVDFNQTLYLAVEIGGTGTPTWDGELLPRKVLGAVPAAFVAETADSADALSGIASSSFLRSDEVDTMTASSSSSLLTLIQNGIGKVLSLFSGATEIFTVLSNGNVGVGTTTPSSRLTVVGDTSLGGSLAIEDNVTIGGTIQAPLLTPGRVLFSTTGSYLTDSASLVFDGTNLGIGTSTPAANLHIYAGAGNALSRTTWSDTTAEGGLIFYQGSNYYGGLESFGSSFATVLYRNSLMLTAARSDLGSIIFRTRTSDAYQERMILTNSGSLGIGTTTPSQMLTVGGTTGSQFLVSSAGVVTDGTWSADTIAATRGGTGLSTITQNQLLIGGAGNTWSQIATSSLGLSASFTTSAGLAALLSDEVGTGGGFVRASSTMLTSPNIVGATLSGTISGGTFSGGTWQGNAIANAYLDSAVILGTEIDSSSELLTLVTDETGTGALVFAGSPTFTGTITAASSTLSGNLSVAGTSTLATTTISNLTLAQALAITSGGTGATTASGARTNLGATTVGSNIFTLANPSAVTLLRINADNTVSAVATSTLGLSSAFTTSAQLAALLSDETGTGASVFNTSPTFSTQLTVPQIVGGTTTASSLSLKSTSGVGSSDYIQFLVGNNGATESMRITTDGSVAIGSTASSARLSVQGVSGSGVDTFRVASSTGATTLAMLANGNLELPGQLISAGVKWQPITDTTPNNGSWSSVTYGNGRFVALSYSGSVVLMSSLDGNNWATSSVLGDDDDWMNLTYGNGLFVAVGQGGDRVMTSPDGINWTARSAVGNNDSWYSVTYGNGLFVEVGYSGDRVMTSPDGINWTARSAAGDDDAWSSVTYGNGLFTAVGWSGDRVMTSPDGINWTARSAAGDDDAWSSVTYGNGLFVAV